MPFLMRKSAEEEYKLCMRLKGTAGPINCLAFGHDGKFLASGGDDEKLRIWDVERKQAYQVIGDELERWGQITCVQWLHGFSENCQVISFGTGRGIFLIYQQEKEGVFKELSSMAVLPFNEPVEAIDYDRNKCRLILCSHTGKIKLFQVEKNGTMIAMWSKNWNDTLEGKCVIPRSIYFTEKGESIAVFGLESGKLVSKSTTTGADKWCKVMKSSIGNVCFNSKRSCLLVDNLAKGFDLYNYPHTSPSDSFVIPRERAFVQQAIFLENETTIACGSDHGTIYIFSVGTAKCLQKIGHRSRKTLIQVLNGCSTSDRHLIAAGSDENKPEIHVWEKKTKTYRRRNLGWGYNPTTSFSILLNVIVIILIFFLMNGDLSRKWLETRSYQEPEVRTAAHEDHSRYHDVEQEKRYSETREPSALIKTATRKIVNKSLIVASAPTVTK